MSTFHDSGISPTRARRMPFISVFEGAAAQMVGTVVFNYSREQRRYREQRIWRAHGFRPVARINITSEVNG